MAKKPLTAVSVLIERLTKEEYEVDDLSDLPQLIEAIRLQRSTGATEAARAIRKKLKYGDPHRQLRALTILDDLIQNAGSSFQRTFADEMLLERLRLLVTDSITDVEVKEKCQTLYRRWASAYKNTPGMESVAALYKQVPQRKKTRRLEDSKVLKETERMDDDEENEQINARKASIAADRAAVAERRRASVAELNTASSSLIFAPASYQPQRGSISISSPTASSVKAKKDKKVAKSKSKVFNLEKEKPQMIHVITMASIESTGLINAIKLINKEKERVSDNADAKRRFEICKQLRKQTYRYCCLVEDEGYLGSLLNANDQLSDVLVLYEQLDKSFDYDSDSEDYEGGNTQAHRRRSSAAQQPPNAALAGLQINDEKAPSMPPRPVFKPSFVTMPEGKGKNKYEEEDGEDDEDDPFADRNRVNTPMQEKKGMTWRDV